jgi:hypothetical protein
VLLQLDEETLLSGFIIPLAGVVGAGEAVVRRSLEQQKSFEIVNPGDV